MLNMTVNGQEKFSERVTYIRYCIYISLSPTGVTVLAVVWFPVRMLVFNRAHTLY